MHLNKLVSEVLVILGIASIVVSGISMMFLQTTYGEIDLNSSQVSSIFYLNKGKQYYLNVIGTDSAVGSVDGQLFLYHEEGTLEKQFKVSFKADYDSYTITPLGLISVSISGNYYINYFDSKSFPMDDSGRIRISVQQSFIQYIFGIFGINDYTLIIIGVILTFFGGFLFLLSVFKGGIFNRTQMISPSELESALTEDEFDQESFASQDFEISTRDTSLDFSKMVCPLCGAKSELEFCYECGSHLVK